MKAPKTFCFAFKCVVPSLVFFLTFLGVHGQEIAEEERQGYYYDVLGKLRIGPIVPLPYGNNFLASNLDVNAGLFIAAAVRIDKSRSIGAQFQYFQGMVVETEGLGIFETSNITHGFAVVTQALVNNKSAFEFNMAVGFGFVNFRNRTADFQRFTDSGVAFMVGGEAAYRLNKTLGLYISIQNQWGLLGSDVPSSQRRFLRNTTLIAPSAGIKFYIL